MPDIIQLLPDSVANQIAAGEVIQRPASALKELLENAVDAGATSIQVIIKDSGKSLIQILDNGCGMSMTDARLSFERHATSKIRNAEDLFAIRTMGFRGEALASIAAIAQVEMKTRKHDEETGTLIEIEGARFIRQETVTCPPGTSFSIRNLFFNVPARRNFLKSNTVEARHIIEEFERVALANPQVAMSLHQNGLEVFKLQAGNLRQRIVSVFGTPYNERLVPVEESTSLLNISGFAGKPEFARKTRGEQFFFVNHRFVKDPYLHHAVTGAFEELLPRDSYASYFLYLDIDPGRIDINIHPTKTEIKFDDDRSVYAIVRAAVKRSLGQFSVAPVLDFERETNFDLPYSMRNAPVQVPTIDIDSSYNPFRRETMPQRPDGWQRLYDVVKPDVAPLLSSSQPPVEESQLSALPEETPDVDEQVLVQIHLRYILSPVKSGLILIDQQAAHERILYERYLDNLKKKPGAIQQKLFPLTLDFNATDAAVLRELGDDFKMLGFDLSEFSAQTFVVQGTPPDLAEGQEKEIIESILEQYKINKDEFRNHRQETVAKVMAKKTALKPGQKLSRQEMKHLVDELFFCQKPSASPDGKPVMVSLSLEELAGKFR